MGSPSASNGSNDTQVSGYEAEKTKQKRGKKNEINKGINVTTYGETETNAKPADYNEEKDDTAARLEIFKKGKKGNAKGTLALLNPLFTKGSEVSRNYFYDDVLKSKKAKKNIGYTQDEFSKLSSTKQEEIYKGYIDNRNSGKTDAFGNVNTGYGRDNDNNVQTQKVTAGGQTILTKEKTPEETKAEETKKEATKYDARQTKKKGRSRSILTSKQGVMKTSADYSLGKKILLGQVV